MDVWIETAAGNIAMAAAVSHIILRKSKDGETYEVALVDLHSRGLQAA